MCKNANEAERTKMNVRTKIGLGIIAPLFTLAVGHTVINKINMNKGIANTDTVYLDKDYVIKAQNLYDARQKVDSLCTIIKHTNKNDSQKIKELSEELISANKNFINAQSEFINQ